MDTFLYNKENVETSCCRDFERKQWNAQAQKCVSYPIFLYSDKNVETSFINMYPHFERKQ